MITFLTENLSTIIVALILAAVVVLVIRKMYRDKKAGHGCSCGGSCGCCPSSGMCHKQ